MVSLRHISTQFHILYDKYFMFMSGHPSIDVDSYLQKLFHSSRCWLYWNPYTNDPNLFESYWNGYQIPINPRKPRRATSHQDPL